MFRDAFYHEAVGGSCVLKPHAFRLNTKSRKILSLTVSKKHFKLFSMH